LGRGELSQEHLARINAKLPDVVHLKKRVLQAPPDFVSMNFPHESNFPIATVCLGDAADVLCEVRYAIFEYYAHSDYYRVIVDPPNDGAALFFERFYIDDAALRLYAAAEHLAKAITCMLDLSTEDLAPFRERRASLQSAVGAYLKSELQSNKLTKAILKLASSPDWKATREYRDDWVHEQPPQIQGTGFVYARERFWQKLDDGSWRLPFGGYTKPELTIEEIHRFVKGAFDDYLTSFVECIDCYEDYLREAGFTIENDDQTKLSS
jgi:hypothetical protein